MTVPTDASANTNGSDISSDSANTSELHNMTISGSIRPSSPAKRSASELDGYAIDTSQDNNGPGNVSPRQSKPSSLLSQSQIASPLPNRSKHLPMDIDQHGSTSTSKKPPGPIDGERPSVDEQVRQVLPMIQDLEMVEGLRAYIVPMTWLNKIRSRTSEGLKSAQFSKEAREGEIGPVDTSELVPSSAMSDLRELKDGFGNLVVPLKPELQPSEDYEFFPQRAWDLVMAWYGLAKGAPVIERFVRDTTSGEENTNLQFELFPPLVTVQKVVNKRERGLETFGDDSKQAPLIVTSRAEKYQSFLRRVKQVAGIENGIKVRVWKIIEMQSTSMSTPGPSPESSPAPQIAPVTNETKLIIGRDVLKKLGNENRSEHLDFKDETANDKYNGSFTVGSVGLSAVQTLVLEEQSNQSTKESGTAIQSKSSQREMTGNGPSGTVGQASTKLTAAAKSSLQNVSMPQTRGRVNKKGRTKGSAGLTNLGNTCYMNSALQCIKSVKELTLYFLEQQYIAEINEDNPLGHKGQVAKAYAGLITSLFTIENNFAPRNFKQTISRVYPTFSGYAQQDSQEFVSSLLDGLHEDLNRIYKKPYIENPDLDDKAVGNPEAIRELGEKYRENFHKRNDSVIIDLFNGWYKNTLVCPVCNKVSITFDPFSQVTLQLPVENTFQHQVTIFPLRDTPRVIDIDIDKNSSVKSLKEYCAQRMEGIKPENLVMAEEYSNKFYKLFEDGEVLSEAGVQKNDKLNMYELDEPPTNWPPLDKKKPKRNFLTLHGLGYDSASIPPMTSPVADRMAIPVYSRMIREPRYPMTDLHPFFILITREEAKDPDSIFRKIMQKVATMTTRELFPESSDVSTGYEEVDGREKSDEKRSDDSKVEVNSTDGEEDFVDVTLTKTQRAANPPASAAMSSSRPKSKCLDPSYYIDAEHRQAFEICAFSSNQDVIPSGFSTVNENQKYPKIDDRVRSVQRRLSTSSWNSRSNSQRRGWDARDTDSGSNSEDELSQSQHSVPELATPSQAESDEDADDSTNEQGRSPTAKKSRSHRFKQGIKGFTRSMKRSKSRGEEYVLKLGEALILDWNQDRYDQYFGAEQPGEFRGMRTDLEIPIVEDVELERKRERRAMRRKAGATLDECFQESAKSEVLSEDNAWYCNRCKEFRRATKTLELWTVPDILVVHLKRFGSGGRFGRDKMDLLVEFPIESLDLNGRVGLPEGKSLTYDLFAVDNHMGGLGGGHYTAHAKNFVDGRWYDYNDSFVSGTNPESAISRSAYLLFYRRRSDQPLGSPRLQELVHKAADSSSASTSDQEQGQSESSSETSTSDSLPGSLGARGNERALISRDCISRYNDSIDEGLADMDDGPDNPLPGIEDPSNRRVFPEQSWSFNGIRTSAPYNSDNGLADSETLGGEDNVSDRPNQGSEVGDRMKDFDDDDFVSGGQMAHMPPGDEAGGEGDGGVEHVVPMEGLQRGRSAEDEVAEIRVTDEDEKMLA